jgi:hypothetical protein
MFATRKLTANLLQPSCAQKANKQHAVCKPMFAVGNHLVCGALPAINLQTSCTHYDCSCDPSRANHLTMTSQLQTLCTQQDDDLFSTCLQLDFI